MIQLLDFLSAIQATIQLTDHSAIIHILTIWITDMCGNWMPTVLTWLTGQVFVAGDQIVPPSNARQQQLKRQRLETAVDEAAANATVVEEDYRDLNPYSDGLEPSDYLQVLPQFWSWLAN